MQHRATMSNNKLPNQTSTNSNSEDATEIYKDGTYLENNKTWHVEDSPWKAKQILNIIRKNDIATNSVCEVGCGAGEILRQLSYAMPNTSFVGYELSPQAFDLCSVRESKQIRYKHKNILEEEVFFDCLLCIDVIEHVEDYLGFIKSLKQKSTYKIFHIPLDISVLSILRSSMMRDRLNIGHLHYFTRETAIATLQDCGYEIVDSFYTTSFCDLPRKTLKGKIAKLPYKILFTISPDIAVRLLGGCSYLILAK